MGVTLTTWDDDAAWRAVTTLEPDPRPDPPAGWELEFLCARGRRLAHVPDPEEPR